MDPRIVLEALVRRLENPALALGKVSAGQFSAWEGQEGAVHDRWAAGRGFLAQALRLARQALATRDPAKINAAVLVCTGYVMEGMKRKIAALRNAGGKVRGEALRLAATMAWAPYVKQFKELGCTGKSRRTVVAQMKRDIFKLANTGEFPDRRTIRKWLPIAQPLSFVDHPEGVGKGREIGEHTGASSDQRAQAQLQHGGNEYVEYADREPQQRSGAAVGGQQQEHEGGLAIGIEVRPVNGHLDAGAGRLHGGDRVMPCDIDNDALNGQQPVHLLAGMLRHQTARQDKPVGACVDRQEGSPEDADCAVGRDTTVPIECEQAGFVSSSENPTITFPFSATRHARAENVGIDETSDKKSGRQLADCPPTR
jgi:hypothetical protein